MQSNAITVDEYISRLPDDKKPSVEKLRAVILSNLPDGFEEQMSYGMIGYVVPLSTYPKGYHVGKNEPLPFLSIAAQKNYISLYHMGLYSEKALEDWFVREYEKQVSTKLDIGKSCIRFKNLTIIPYDLIAELCKKMTVDEYISIYEQAARR